MAYRELEIGLLVRLRPAEAVAELYGALADADWIVADAAAALDVSVPTFYRLAARLVGHGPDLIGEARQHRETAQRERDYNAWIGDQQVA